MAVSVLGLFLTVPWAGMQCMILAFPVIFTYFMNLVDPGDKTKWPEKDNPKTFVSHECGRIVATCDTWTCSQVPIPGLNSLLSYKIPCLYSSSY